MKQRHIEAGREPSAGGQGLLISVHMPKTAGTSFSVTLKRSFGDAFLRDSQDLPINTPVHERNRSALQACLSVDEGGLQGVECIHGHFLPVKYLLLSLKIDICYVTWLRNPVDRLISHYNFWHRSFSTERAPLLHRQMIEEAWSLERFCLGPELRDLYGQFLFAFPMEYFSFIGITEFYEDDLAFFSTRFLGVSVEPQRRNVGNASASGYQIDGALRRDIEQYHSNDMDLYRRALQMRQARLQP